MLNCKEKELKMKLVLRIYKRELALTHDLIYYMYFYAKVAFFVFLTQLLFKQS